MTWPTALYVVGLALLTSVMAFVWLAVTVADTSVEVRPLPEAVALLVIEPASMSAWVIVCVEVQIVSALGACGALPHGVIAACLSSSMLKGTATVLFLLFVIV